MCPQSWIEAVRKLPDSIRHWTYNVSYSPVPANARDMSSGAEPIAVHRGCVAIQSVTVIVAAQLQSTISAAVSHHR